jgi:copper chaperone
MKNETLSIQGMSGGHCVTAVTQALSGIPGVVVKKVEVGRAEISYDEASVSPKNLARAIEVEGFQLTGRSSPRR